MDGFLYDRDLCHQRVKTFCYVRNTTNKEHSQWPTQLLAAFYSKIYTNCVICNDDSSLDHSLFEFGDLVSTSNALQEETREVFVETSAPLLWTLGYNMSK